MFYVIIKAWLREQFWRKTECDEEKTKIIGNFLHFLRPAPLFSFENLEEKYLDISEK